MRVDSRLIGRGRAGTEAGVACKAGDGVASWGDYRGRGRAHFGQSGLGTVSTGSALLLRKQDRGRRHGTSLFLGVRAVLLPGLTFLDLGRPASGLVCYALQASLVGWLPAALWATFARRQVVKKHKRLAARLR